MAGLNVDMTTDFVSVHFKMSDAPFKAMSKGMERTSGEIMAKAIKEVLREELSRTQSELKKDAGPKLRGMAGIVADSLIVEVGNNTNNEAEVRFGSDPIDSGGVEGKREGKLAAILEYGARPFEYGFTFMTIENSSSWGSVGGGFINAKGTGNQVHKGFEPLDWLSKTRDRAAPKIEVRIQQALQEAYS